MRKEVAAKFTSRCSACGSDIRPGETITYDPAVKYSSRHKICPAVKQSPKPKVKEGTLLNGPVIAQPQVSRLSDEAAAEILAKIGSDFVRPIPTSEPTLGLGHKVTIGGVELEIGTANTWVGIATDHKGGQGWAISLIDGAILEHFPPPDGWKRLPIDKWTRQLGAPLKMERHGKNSVHVGDIERTESGWYIVTAVDKPYYLSAEDAEDFDMFSRGGGWGTPYEIREITEPPAEREKREAKEREKLAAENAKKQARADFDAKFAELTAGLVRVGLDWDLVAGDGRPYVASWRDGNNYSDLGLITSKVTGKPAVINPHGGYDDYRMSMFVDPETAQAAFEATRERSKKYEHPDTPQSAQDWLEKYRGCVGSEYYEWLAKQQA